MANEKELKLHDGTALFIPSGWTVEIEETLESSAASLSDGTGYAKVTPTIIARLVPSENAQASIKYMHDRECRRQKDEGVLCQDNCYFKTSGLKECPVKSGIVATGIPEVAPESGEKPEHELLIIVKEVLQWCKVTNKGAEWKTSHERIKEIREAVDRYESVSPPSQAEINTTAPVESEEELWDEMVGRCMEFTSFNYALAQKLYVITRKTVEP